MGLELLDSIHQDLQPLSLRWFAPPATTTFPFWKGWKRSKRKSKTLLELTISTLVHTGLIREA